MWSTSMLRTFSSYRSESSRYQSHFPYKYRWVCWFLACLELRADVCVYLKSEILEKSIFDVVCSRYTSTKSDVTLPSIAFHALFCLFSNIPSIWNQWNGILIMNFSRIRLNTWMRGAVGCVREAGLCIEFSVDASTMACELYKRINLRQNTHFKF